MPDYTAGRARLLLEPTARGFYTNARKAIKTEMAGRNLDVDVRLRANTTGFYTDAESKLRAVKDLSVKVKLHPVLADRFRADAKLEIERQLAGLYSTVQIKPDLDLTRANVQMEAWRRRQEAKELNIRVRTTSLPGTPGTPGGAPRTLGRDGDAPKVKPKIDSAWKTEAERDLRRDIASLKRDMDNNFRLRVQPTIAGVQLRLPLGSLGLQVIPGAVASIGSLIAALQELSQVGLAVPGGLAVAGSSIGTLAIGLSGMANAFKALTDEQDRSAEQATTDAARMTTAYDKVQNATLDITDAQRDLTTARKDARRTLEDLHNEERSSYLSVAEAALDLRKAQNELAKGGFAGPLDRDEAILREARARESLSEAMRRQNRTKEDVAEADKKGIDGSDQVLNAQRRLADSVDALAKAQRDLAMESSAAANAHDKSKAALERLGPEAAKLVQSLFDQRGAWQQLRTEVSNNMFRGLSDEIDTLIKADFPLLQRGLGGIGEAWNGTFKQLSQTLRSDSGQSILSRIFGGTEETQKRFNDAIKPIIESVGTLASAGAESMPRLADAIGTVATRFNEFITKADNNGTLDQWINKGMDAFGQLARAIGNIGGIINGVTKAFGGTFLNNLESLTQKLSNFLNSARGQNDLREFIRGVKDDFDAWRPILDDLPGILHTAMEAGRTAINTFLPVLNVFTELLEHAPGLVQAVATAFLGWSVIRPTLTAISGLAQGLSAVVTDVGTRFTLTATKANEQVGKINNAFEQANSAGGGANKFATRMSKFATFMGSAGPWGFAIAAAVGALFTLSDSHDDAAEKADNQAAAEERLADALERVTNASGAASLAELGKEMEDFSADNPRLRKGNVRQAVQDLGIDPTTFATSVQPGGEVKADEIREKLRGSLRPVVSQLLQSNKEAAAAYAEAGISEDDFVNALMGDESAINKIDTTFKRYYGTGIGSALRYLTFGDISRKVDELQGPANAAALAGTFLNERQPQLRNAVGSARAAQRTATGVDAKLSPGPNGGEAFFAGMDVLQVSTDGDQVAVRIQNPPQAKLDLLAARNDRVEGPYPGPNGPIATVYLTDEDAKALISYAAGGPTPDGKGRGPTGGHVVEVHDEEWVLPKHARAILGDPFLRAITGKEGINRSTHKGGFDIGGPGKKPPPLPFQTDAFDPYTSTSSPLGMSPGPGNASNDPSSAATPSGVTADSVGTPGAVGSQGFGTSLANAFLSPWGMTMGPDGTPVSVAGQGNSGATTDPGTWLGNWAGNFATALGSTLISGITGFFGFSADNPYVNAFKQTLGFYSDKLGSGTDQYVDPATQGLVDSGLNSFNNYPGYTADGSGTVSSASGGLPATSATGLTSSAVVGEKFKGSGVISAGKNVDNVINVAAAPNAQVIGDANIVNYIRSLAEAEGLTVGDEGKTGGNPYRNENASQHEVGRAVDVFGTPEQRRAFLLKWNSDPRLRAATRMIIDDNNTDQEAYAGKTRSEGAQVSYSRGAHPDHIHLALEGVPGFIDPATNQLMAVALPSTGLTDTGAQAAAVTNWLASGGVAAPGATTPGATTSGIPPLFGPQTTPGGQQPPITPRYLAPRGGRGGNRITGSTPGSGANWRPRFSGSSARGSAQGEQRTDGDTGTPFAPQAAGPQRIRSTQGVRLASNASPLHAPPANYQGGNQEIYDAVWTAYLQTGFPPEQWGDAVNIINHESNWKRTISNPKSGAFGLFQFLGSTQRAYLPDKNPNPYVQGLAGMKYIKDRYKTPAAAWQFWQGHNWYDTRNGILPRGVTIAHNDTGEDEIVIGRSAAQAARAIIQNAQNPTPPRPNFQVPDVNPIRTPGPRPPRDADIPSVLPPPGTPSVAAPPPTLPAPGISAPPLPTAPNQQVAPGPDAGAGVKHHLLPAISTGIKSGAATLGNIAQQAISMGAAAGTMGASAAAGGAGGMGGMGGPSISGLFQQGGKIVEGIANVGAAFASGFTNFGGTTPNPYGVQLRSNEQAPPLAQDNRRVHNGDNNFASMEEWRRQNQVQDAQDMQAQMSRIG